MEQLSFFADAGHSKGIPEEMLEYRPGLFTAEESDFFLDRFIRTEHWWQPTQKMYGKEVLTPRLISWHGARLKKDPLPWNPELLFIKERIERLSGFSFNSVLLNYYRDGNDSVAWHSDKEWVYGKNPIIASVSFGQVRSFDIRRKTDHQEQYSVRLEHGSFLLMKAGLQEMFEHRIAKSSQIIRPRVNLTFRTINRKEIPVK